MEVLDAHSCTNMPARRFVFRIAGRGRHLPRNSCPAGFLQLRKSCPEHDPNDSATVTIKGGQAEIAVSTSAFARTELYSGFRYGDANLCVTLTTPATDKSEKQDAGIAFWADSFASFYTFEITPEGMFSVAMLSSGKWSYPVHLTASPAIVQGTGKTNTLRVLTKGSTASLFINDQQVGTLDGTPPAGGGMVGFVGDASDQLTGTVTFDFTNFTVAIP